MPSPDPGGLPNLHDLTFPADGYSGKGPRGGAYAASRKKEHLPGFCAPEVLTRLALKRLHR